MNCVVCVYLLVIESHWICLFVCRNTLDRKSALHAGRPTSSNSQTKTCNTHQNNRQITEKKKHQPCQIRYETHMQFLWCHSVRSFDFFFLSHRVYQKLNSLYIFVFMLLMIFQSVFINFSNTSYILFSRCVRKLNSQYYASQQNQQKEKERKKNVRGESAIECDTLQYLLLLAL